MPSDSEEILDDSVDRQETLRLGSGFEPSHLSFALPSRLVRDLSPAYERSLQPHADLAEVERGYRLGPRPDRRHARDAVADPG